MTVWFLFLFLLGHSLTSVIFLNTAFSYMKNILEKMTCRQDHDRETFQHVLIMLMSFTGGLLSATTGQTLEQAS